MNSKLCARFMEKAKKPVPKDIQMVSDFLDTRFEGPAGFRFGWDGIIGLIPGVGDFVTSMGSFYIVVRAAMLGTPIVVLVRMGLNILLDSLFDAIPVLGMFIDFAFKANVRNVNLLRASIGESHQVARASKWVVGLTLAVIFGCLMLSIALVFVIAMFIYQQIFGAT